MYKIEFNGQHFYLADSLAEFKLIELDGRFWIFNVNTLGIAEIEQTQYDCLREWRSNLATPLDEKSWEMVMKLGLVPISQGGKYQPAPGEPVSAGIDFRISTIALLVTQDCNMACVYCYGGESGQYLNKGYMSIDTATDAINLLMVNAPAGSQVNIVFFGGEPLLNFPLIEYVVSSANLAAKASSITVRFNITTNGTLLTSKIAKFLKENHFKVLLSFDGNEEYMRIQRPLKKGGNSYKAVAGKIHWLKQEKVNFSAHAVLTNEGDPVTLCTGMKEHSIEKYDIRTAAPTMIPGFSSSPPAKGRLNDYLDLMASEIKSRISKRLDLPETIMASQVVWLSKIERQTYRCGVGKTQVAVDRNGDIYPCHRFVGAPDRVIGNISSNQFDKDNIYSKVSIDSSPKCKSCWARYLCGGSCLSENIVWGGELDTPPRHHCEEVQESALRAICVFNGLDDASREWIKLVC